MDFGLGGGRVAKITPEARIFLGFLLLFDDFHPFGGGRWLIKLSIYLFGLGVRPTPLSTPLA